MGMRNRTSGDTNPAHVGSVQMRSGIRETHGVEIQLAEHSGQTSWGARQTHRGIRETYGGKIQSSGDSILNSGEGQMRKGIGVTRGAESQTSKDGSPTSVC